MTGIEVTVVPIVLAGVLSLVLVIWLHPILILPHSGIVKKTDPCSPPISLQVLHTRYGGNVNWSIPGKPLFPIASREKDALIARGKKYCLAITTWPLNHPVWLHSGTLRKITAYFRIMLQYTPANVFGGAVNEVIHGRLRWQADPQGLVAHFAQTDKSCLDSTIWPLLIQIWRVSGIHPKTDI